MGERGPDPSVSVEEVFSVFTDLEDPCEPLTTADLADELDIAQRTALKRLKQTEDETELVSKKIGARGRVWWLPHDPKSKNSKE